MSCEICGKEFVYIDDWLSHVLIKHSDKEINGKEIPESLERKYDAHIKTDKWFNAVRDQFGR